MATDPSAQIYTPLVLQFFYDFWVLRVSNWFAWRCPTRSVLVPLFDRYLAHSSAHLDVGAGTGYYPAQGPTVAFLSKLKTLAFLDVNPTTLTVAKQRVEAAGYKGPEIATYTHSVFHPLPQELRGKFDTVSLFYLLHCLPGSFPTKASNIIATLLPALVPGPDSTLYGATILASGVHHNLFGRLLLWLYNRKGIFSNYDDDVNRLRAGLAPYFDEVEIEVVGTVALFVCRGPKSQNLK